MTARAYSDDELVAAVQKGFFEQALGAQMQRMDAGQTEFMIRLFGTSKEKAEEILQDGVKDGLRVFQIARNRTLLIGFPVTATVQLFISLLCESPGDVTLYLSYAIWRAKEMHHVALDLNALVRVFPFGFWDKPTRDALWDAQKVPFDCTGFNDNLLDAPAVLAWLGSSETGQPAPQKETIHADTD